LIQKPSRWEGAKEGRRVGGREGGRKGPYQEEFLSVDVDEVVLGGGDERRDVLREGGEGGREGWKKDM